MQMVRPVTIMIDLEKGRNGVFIHVVVLSINSMPRQHDLDGHLSIMKTEQNSLRQPDAWGRLVPLVKGSSRGLYFHAHAGLIPGLISISSVTPS